MKSQEVQTNMDNVGAGIASMRGAEADSFLHKQDETYRSHHRETEAAGTGCQLRLKTSAAAGVLQSRRGAGRVVS